MCGIFGISYKNGVTQPDHARLHQTAKALSHRGPDYTGIYCENAIGLVHTRLSLLDLNPRSNQPFWDSSGRYALVYNGEIYNFQEVKLRLQNQGIEFHTSSDTEMLLYALIHYGVEVLDELEGMFAFGFYDKEEQSVLIGRDRFGIKPLYYSINETFFTFASEHAAFSPWTKKELNNFAISSYLQGFGGPLREQTFFTQVSVLPPGHTMKVTQGVPDHEPRSFFALPDFWNPSLREELQNCSDDAIVDRLDELLFHSVKRHMLSDTPVGALCSGGVDSSIIMSMASKISSNLAIFHADVVGRNSERDAAEELAKHLKLDLKVVETTDQDFIDDIPIVTKHYGHPFSYHPNSVPFLKVTNLVKSNNVKAIMTGEAADECYLGYSYLPTQDIFARVQKLIATSRKALINIPHVNKMLFPESLKDITAIRGLYNGFETEIEEQQLKEAALFLSQSAVKNKDLKTLHLLSYHLRSLLHRNDSLGMASSIEARFPFLGHDVVEFAVNLPYRYKIRPALSAYNESKHPFLISKWAVRKVADRYLPPSLSRRPKKGFPTDAFERMNISHSAYNNSFISEYFGLSDKQLAHFNSVADRDLKMRLLLLDVWGRIHIENQSVDKVRQHLRQNISL